MICRGILYQNRQNWILPIYRIFYPLLIINEILGSMSTMISRSKILSCFPIPIFSSFSIPILKNGDMSFALILLLGSLFLLSIGLFSNLAALSSMTLFIWVFGSTISCAAGKNPDYIPWNHAIVVFNLLVLAVSPCGKLYSLDFYFRKNQIKEKLQHNWPILLLKFNLVYAYFSGGIAKLQHGFDWMNGYSLQTQLIYRHLNLNTPLALPIIYSHEILIMISVITVVAELLFPLALFSKKAAIFFISGSLLFQLTFAVIINLKWMSFFGWSYLIYFLEVLAVLMGGRLHPKGHSAKDSNVVKQF